MKNRFLIMIGLLLCSSLLGGATLAQEELWQSYLFNTIDKTLLVINSNSLEGATYSLGLGGDEFIGGREVLFTQDGSTAVLCNVRNTPGEFTGSATFRVRDLPNENEVLNIDYGQAMGCQVSAFNPDETQVAVGLTRYFPGSADETDDFPSWQLLIVDIATGETIHELNADMPGTETVGGGFSGGALMPNVRHFGEEAVNFVAFPWGTDAGFDFSASTWSFADNAISEAPQVWGQIFDHLPVTDEFVWVAFDPALPAGQVDGPIPTYNVVLLAEGAEAEPRQIYQNAEWLPVGAQFVNNGQAILITEIEAFQIPEDPNQPFTPPRNRLLLLDRDGNLSEIGTYSSFTVAQPAPDGFAVLSLTFSDPVTQELPATLALDYFHIDGANETLWSQEFTEFNFAWDLVWTTPSPPALESFSAFQPLG